MHSEDGIEFLEEQGVPPEIISGLKEEKIKKLYPPQLAAIEAGAMDGKSLVLSMPTASGKTLVATLAAINVIRKGRKAVYICPLVALASEKYEYYKKLFGIRWKVAMSVGDLDSSDPRLAECDFIICTTEKLDSLIRHGAAWVKELGLVIIDEVHMLNDPSRGPTLEVLITQLKQLLPHAQTLAFSATIHNADELSEWLGCKLVESDFRPVKLHEGYTLDGKIKFLDKGGYELADGETERAILQNTLDLKKQVIFFVSTRRNAESLAQELTTDVRQKLTKVERAELEKLSSEVLEALEIPTKQCRKLAQCIKSGSAFHHAGLLHKQKKFIEDNFRSGLIRSIAATPTLAMGVNLPAFRVVIRDIRRYYNGLGMTYIPVLEYKQFVGRAGRPQYDSFGESVLLAKSDNEADELVERFILGEPEKIRSKLAMEPVLRMHTLSLVANAFASTGKALYEFFGRTFYAHQYGDLGAIEEKIEGILEQLDEWGFIERMEDRIVPTRVGKRVAELYLDPLTAHNFIEALNYRQGNVNDFGMMHAVASADEIAPQLSVRAGEYEKVMEAINGREKSFMQNVPAHYDTEFEFFMRFVKTAMLLDAWANEKTEDEILSEFKVAPGELNGKLRIADWLVYSLGELALLLGMKDSLKDIRRLRMRLKYGIREELMPLVRLKGIGRVRSRRMFNAGMKTLEDLRKVPMKSLARVVGPNVAYDVKKQLGEDAEPPKSKPIQSKLESFNGDER
ncbi:MAG: DEAD/DEAH box helicase [Candidatus Aenigmatarchaeota archaeon]